MDLERDRARDLEMDPDMDAGLEGMAITGLWAEL
jgi:hypothetical protein